MEKSILQRIASGDRSAMQECIDRYGPLIWSLARRWAMGRADAEDAVQEVYISIWKHAERYDPGVSSESTFITMIARRRLIDSTRKRSRSREKTNVEELPTEETTTSEDPAEAIAETSPAMRALRQLNENQRRVLEMSIEQGMTHSEISARTGMPLGTVKSHARRGLLRIRDLLGGAHD